MNERAVIDVDTAMELIRMGELKYGTLLEFQRKQGDESSWFPDVLPLRGVNPINHYGACFMTDCGSFFAARFPAPELPDLMDGDPVLVRGDGEQSWKRRVFSNKCDDEDGVWCYVNCRNAWTSLGQREYWGFVSIPTPEKLEAAGLDRNWFAGRRGINQNG